MTFFGKLKYFDNSYRFSMSTPKQRNNAQQLKLHEIFEAASTVVDQKMWVNLLT